jgi:hypothetical protein
MVFGVKNCTSKFYFNNAEIEIVKEYKYVGTIFSTEGNIFKKHSDYTLGKALQATYKIQNNCRPLGQVPPDVAIKLFNSLVLPIIEYGAEIWSGCFNTKDIHDLDIFQLKFLKRILKVRQQTSSIAILSEVGECPISLKLNLKILKYWVRVINLPDNHLLKQMYNSLLSLDQLGFNTWATVVKKTLKLYDCERMWENQNVTDSVFKTVKTGISNEYAEHTLSKIANSDENPKLRTYKLFKEDFKLENYLLIHIPKYRYHIARFRLSSHDLAIELGRHTKPKTPIDQRLCTYCSVVEDEMHVLVSCKRYINARNVLCNVVDKHVNNFEALSHEDQFYSIMTSQDPDVLYALGKYLVSVSDTRR